MKTVKYVWARYNIETANEDNVWIELENIVRRHSREARRLMSVGFVRDQLIKDMATVIIEEKMTIERYKYLKRYWNKGLKHRRKK